jgi:hypothetical protein
MALQTDMCRPGRRVRVVQQVPRMGGAWTEAVEGVVTRYQQAKTGSWYAHAKDDRLWLDRLELRLDDGELTILNLDQYTHIEDLTPPPPPVEPESDAEETEPDVAAV